MQTITLRANYYTPQLVDIQDKSKGGSVVADRYRLGRSHPRNFHAPVCREHVCLARFHPLERNCDDRLALRFRPRVVLHDEGHLSSAALLAGSWLFRCQGALYGYTRRRSHTNSLVPGLRSGLGTRLPRNLRQLLHRLLTQGPIISNASIIYDCCG